MFKRFDEATCSEQNECKIDISLGEQFPRVSSFLEKFWCQKVNICNSGSFIEYSKIKVIIQKDIENSTFTKPFQVGRLN